MKLYNESKSDREIAAALGVHRTPVRVYRLKLGLESKFSLKARSRLELAKSCSSISEFAKKSGQDYSNAHKYLVEHKLHGSEKRYTVGHVLKFYYENINLDWREMARKFYSLDKDKYVDVKSFATKVGLALAKECRDNPDCPLKPLLPEFKLTDKDRRIKPL